MEAEINRRLPSWIAKHLDEYIRSNGKAGHMWDSRPFGGDKLVPTLLLTTLGRQSGRRSTMPLIYCRDGDGFVVAGSRGGAPEHPHWYLNLISASGGWIQVADEHHKVKAEPIEASEREPIWRTLVELFPPFLDYARNTQGIREIPLVRLTPVPDSEELSSVVSRSIAGTAVRI